MRRVIVAIVAAAVFVALCWRPVAAWWCLDQGNLAFVKGDRTAAAGWFARGLSFESDWHALLEDHARAVLDVDPATALAELRRADCGQPCQAEAGDAETRLGRASDAVDDYLSAHAMERVGSAVQRLSDDGRYDDAIALERALAARLGNGMLAEADLASTYHTIGDLDTAAAGRAVARAPAYRRNAIETYRRASQLAPFNEQYLLSLGFAQSRWGDRRAARATFERLLDLHPHQSDAERAIAAIDASPSGNR
jgi:tetratricopeptide (TPR) repeat protein